MTTGKNLRIGWLLLLLSRSRRGYGYELRRAFEQHGLSLDPALLYRTLREMESAGLISSVWMRSSEGPHRRVYAITPDGATELARIAETIGAARDAHDAFLTAFGEASDYLPRTNGEGN